MINITEINSRDLTELDLRQEVADFFNGKDFGNEKFNVFLHRQIRIDDTKYPYINRIKCPTCNHDYNNEGKIGCPTCDGIGYLWDEKLIIGYIYRPQHIRLADQLSKFSNIGRMDNPAFVIVTPHKYKVKTGDFVYAISTQDNGGIVIPLVKTHRYMCTSGLNLRLDFNKVEFNSSVLSET